MKRILKITTMAEQSKRKILIVEDDPFISDMYATKLKKEGYDPKVAENGKVGLAELESSSFDLILLDIVMPQMDGFEMMKRLKAEKETSNIPVILLTNLGQKDDVEQGLALGADDYIVKAHFTPGEVIAKIEERLKANKGGSKKKKEPSKQ